MPIPRAVLMDSGPAIANFKNITRKHNLDVIDVESLMVHFFAAVHLEEVAKMNLYNVLDTFMEIASEEIGTIFDEDGYCGSQFALFNDVLLDLMQTLYWKIIDYRMYISGRLPYKFVSILENGTILLERNF